MLKSCWEPSILYLDFILSFTSLLYVSKLRISDLRVIESKHVYSTNIQYLALNRKARIMNNIASFLPLIQTTKDSAVQVVRRR